MSKKKDVKESRTCKREKCGKEFTPRQKTQLFCSPKCRLDDWIEKHPRISLDKQT